MVIGKDIEPGRPPRPFFLKISTVLGQIYKQDRQHDSQRRRCSRGLSARVAAGQHWFHPRCGLSRMVALAERFSQFFNKV